jgi:hypothetical protein
MSKKGVERNKGTRMHQKVRCTRRLCILPERANDFKVLSIVVIFQVNDYLSICLSIAAGPIPGQVYNSRKTLRPYETSKDRGIAVAQIAKCDGGMTQHFPTRPPW